MSKIVVAICCLLYCTLMPQSLAADRSAVYAWFSKFDGIRRYATLTREEKQNANSAVLLLLRGKMDSSQRKASRAFLTTLLRRYKIAATELSQLQAPTTDLSLLCASYRDFYATSADLCALCLHSPRDLHASRVISELWDHKIKLERLGIQFDAEECAMRTKYGIASRSTSAH